MYTGQPVPSTTYQSARFMVSDGKSVRVSVPANSGDIAAGQLCYFDGFLGFAMQSLSNNATAAQELILQIEAAEYETDQILTTDTMARGTRIFWDAENKRLTESPTTIFAGVVTVAKDANNVIWFLLIPGVLGDEAMTAIGDLADLETTEQGSVVGAINEVNANANAAATAAAALLAYLQNCVQTGLLAGEPTTASTHADAGAFDFNINVSEGIVVVNGVLAEIAAQADLDVASGDTSPLSAEAPGIVYTIIAAETDGVVTLAAVAGTAAAEPEAADDETITTAVGHDNWIRIATTTLTRTDASTVTQTYSNGVRPKP
jgi:hypothetical protein